MAHFCYIKPIFSIWNSQGRHVHDTHGRTFESTMLCLVGREQDANVFMSFDANINPNILQNCTIRLLYCSFKKPRLSGVRIPARERYLSPKIAQVGSGAHPASHSMGTGVHPQGVKLPGRAADHSPACCAQFLRTAVTYNPPRYLHSVATPRLRLYGNPNTDHMLTWQKRIPSGCPNKNKNRVYNLQNSNRPRAYVIIMKMS
jgi:hypothetical protein